MLQIRKPKLKDFESIYSLCRMFFTEGAYRGFTFDRERCIETVNQMLTGNVECLMVEIEGIPLAFAAWTYERHCTVEPVGMTFLFYTAPSARGTGAARMLRDAMDKAAQEAGCAAFYIASTAGFNDDGKNQKLFTNLFLKNGFVVVGEFMRKVYAK